MNATKTTKAIQFGLATFVGGLLVTGQLWAADMAVKSGPFEGPKANTGYEIGRAHV